MKPAAIALDDETTWPAGLCALIDENLELLRAHRRAELRYINEKYILKRNRQPPNPHNPQRERLIEECDRR